MSLVRCIPELLAEGKLTRDQADRAEAVFGNRQRHYRRSMNDAAADALAGVDTVEAMAAEAARRRRLALLSVEAQRRALEDMARYNGGEGGPLDPKAAIALFDRDSRAPYSNVEARRKVIKGRAHAMIDGILQDHRRTITGKLRNRAQMEDIGRELFGQKTGNLNAAELASGWTQAAEMLRRRFNAAGGNIGKIDRWGLPQSHDSRAVRLAGYAEWRNEVWPRLDRERMVDEDTGLPFDDATLEDALRDVFETVRTDGWSKRVAGPAGARSMANRRSEHRFLHFKSYDDWAAYRERFGSGTAFDAMMGHIEAMSRDIAAMEILGPNPNASVRWLQDALEKDAALHGDDAGRGTDAAHKASRQLTKLWDEYRGALRRPESRRIALAFGAVRSLQTSAKLGSAVLSAIGDTMTQTVTRLYNGLPASTVIGDYIGLLNPANATDRRFAVRRGLIAEEWAAMTAAQNRYLVEELTGEVASRLAEGTLRLSGLSAFTQAGRWAFGMEFLDTLQGQFRRNFDNVDEPLRRAMERYGITAADWGAIKSTPLADYRGQRWFLPQEMEDEAIADKVMEMILTETDFAVPVADLRTRALMSSVAPRGTIPGELARSALLFKSFGIAVLLSHGRRALEQASIGGKLGYAAGFVIAMTIGGAISTQLKQIAAGKDPRPMNDPSFWGAATAQGGGFGIFGDFFAASENRFGGGFAETLAGPLVGTTQNLADLTAGNAFKTIRGDETDVGRDLVRLVDQELPGQSLWYLRLAFDRAVTDQLQIMADPDYRDSWRRMQRRTIDQGQDIWWDRGEISPERMPDVSNAWAGEVPPN